MLKQLGATRKGSEEQADTYFHVPDGRLKLREIADAPAELIYYERNESGKRRDCNYWIFRTDDPEPLKALLEEALGVDMIVAKKREVYYLDRVKINLDRVVGLGDFIEFEVPADEGFEPADRRARELKSQLGVRDDDVVACSYSDLVRGRSANTRTG